MTSTQRRSGELNHGIILPNSPDNADAQTFVKYAAAAEEAGWDGIFFGDHLIYPWDDPDPDAHQGVFDPWTVLAGIATRTETIKLGTWITPVPRRQPWQLARDLATLDHLSAGRVILGAGLGTEPDFTKFGRSFDMASLGDKYDEALDVLTGLWNGEPFDYDGEYYTVDEAVVLPTPVQEPRIPIVMGCWWPNKKPFERGARWDGIMPNWPSMYGDEGAHGEQATGSPEEEVREMLEYYLGLTDEPGDIFLPIDFPGAPSDFVETCRTLGVTWTITTTLDKSGDYNLSLDRIQQGPPRQS